MNRLSCCAMLLKMKSQDAEKKSSRKRESYMQYNFSKLWESQFWGFYKFKSFYEYASDEEAQISYYKQLGVFQVGENGELLKKETPQLLLDMRLAENESVLDMIKNQLIVFLFTRYEFIIQDTMKCLICDDPKRFLHL